MLIEGRLNSIPFANKVFPYIGWLIVEVDYTNNPTIHYTPYVESAVYNTSSSTLHLKGLEPSDSTETGQAVGVDSKQTLSTIGVRTIDRTLDGMIYKENSLHSIEKKFKTWRFTVKNEVATLDGKPYTSSYTTPRLVIYLGSEAYFSFPQDVLSNNKAAGIDINKTQVLNFHMGFRDKRPGKSLNYSYDTYNTHPLGDESNIKDPTTFFLTTGSSLRPNQRSSIELLPLEKNASYKYRRNSDFVELEKKDIDPSDTIKNYLKLFKEGGFYKNNDHLFDDIDFSTISTNLTLPVRVNSAPYPYQKDLLRYAEKTERRQAIFKSPFFQKVNIVDKSTIFLYNLLGVLNEIYPSTYGNIRKGNRFSLCKTPKDPDNRNPIYFPNDIYNNIDLEYEILLRNIDL